MQRKFLFEFQRLQLEVREQASCLVGIDVVMRNTLLDTRRRSPGAGSEFDPLATLRVERRLEGYQ